MLTIIKSPPTMPITNILSVAFVITLFVIAMISLFYHEMAAKKKQLRAEIFAVRENYLKMIKNINSYLSKNYELNDTYLKSELISILQLVDHDLLISDDTNVALLDKLLENRDEITSKFLEWCRINTLSNDILLSRKNIVNDELKLISEFNAAIQKHQHLKAKYIGFIDTIDFQTERKFYDYYFSKLKELGQQSYDALAQGNFIKAFTIKHYHTQFYNNISKMLKEPSTLLQKIHDANYQVGLLESDLCNSTKNSKYFILLNKLGDKDIKGSTLDQFSFLRKRRENYFTTLKWMPDPFKKEEHLRELSREVTRIGNIVDRDIKEKKKLRDELLSRASNINNRDVHESDRNLSIFGSFFEDGVTIFDRKKKARTTGGKIYNLDNKKDKKEKRNVGTSPKASYSENPTYLGSRKSYENSIIENSLLSEEELFRH